VVTPGGRVGLVIGHSQFAAIVVPVVRGEKRRRSDVAIDGRIHWTETEAALPGIVTPHVAYDWSESPLRQVGEASDALRGAVLAAQIRYFDDRAALPLAA
jgi:hypothetical protein